MASSGIEVARAYVTIVPSLEGSQKKISQDLGVIVKNTGNNAGKSLGSALLDGASKVLKTGAKAILGTVANVAKVSLTAAATGMSIITKQAISSYAEFEQLEGGVKKLFGDDVAAVIQKNAKEAFQSAGLSANEYMETVTGFSAALIRSLDGDTEKAAEIADMAIRDMSDNANTYGTNMESIQNAYAGFAKGQFNMLDNLKLGYSGSKAGMEQLLADAEAISGVKYDIESYADIAEAIHVIQEDMNIAGTTAKEALGTIEGSVNSTKAAWTNFVTALAGGGDLTESLDSLKTALFGIEGEANGLVNNVLPKIQEVFINVADSIPSILNSLLPSVVSAISNILPALLNAAISLVQSVDDAIYYTIMDGTLNNLFADIVDAIPKFFNSVINLVTDSIEALATLISSDTNGIGQALQSIGAHLITAFRVIIFNTVNIIEENLPMILDVIISLLDNIISDVDAFLPSLLDSITNILVSIIEAVVKVVPKLLQAITGMLPKIIKSLLSNLTTIVDAIVDAIPGLVDDIVNACMTIVDMLPQIVDSILELLPEFINKILNKLLSSVPSILNGLTKLVQSVAKALPQIIQSIVKIIPDLLKSIISAITDNLDVIIEGLVNLVMALVEALPDITLALVEAIPDIIMSIMNAVLDALPIIVESLLKLVGQIIINLPTILGSLALAVFDILKLLIWDIPEMLVTELIPKLVETIGKVIVVIWNALKSAWKSITNWFSNIFKELANWFFNTEIGKFMVNLATVGIMLWNEITNFLHDLFAPIVQWCKDLFDHVVNWLKDLLTPIIDWCKNIYDKIKSFLTDTYNSVRDKFNAVLNTVKTVFTNIYNAIKTPIDNAKNAVTNTINNMKSTITSVFNSIYSTVQNIFNKIKSAITGPIDAAKNAVSNAISSMRSIINNAGFSLPHIKLPHFSITGKLSINPPSVPHFGVSWYDKGYDEAQILRDTTVFGMANGNLLAGGERGNEVVVGEDHLIDLIRDNTSTGNITVNVYGAPGQDEDTLARIVIDKIQDITNSKEVVYA